MKAGRIDRAQEIFRSVEPPRPLSVDAAARIEQRLLGLGTRAHVGTAGRLRPLVTAIVLFGLGGVAGAGIATAWQRVTVHAPPPEPVPTSSPQRRSATRATRQVPAPPALLEEPRAWAVPAAAPSPAAAPAVRGHVRRLAPPPTQSDLPAVSAVTPAAPEPAAARPGTSTLAEEARLVGDAVRALRRERDAGRALALLDEHARLHPQGALGVEAVLARVDALRLAGRDVELLGVLDGVSPSDLPRSAELRLLRGELRAKAGRCTEALADFEAVSSDPRAGGFDERITRGRAACLPPAGR